MQCSSMLGVGLEDRYVGKSRIRTGKGGDLLQMGIRMERGVIGMDVHVGAGVESSVAAEQEGEDRRYQKVDQSETCHKPCYLRGFRHRFYHSRCASLGH